MADDRRLVISSEPLIAPEEIARRTFSTVFRGFDAVEVRTYLSRIADELALARERQRHLEQQLAELQAKPVHHVELDEDALTAALGEEAAHVLRTAKQAAADIKARAEENVERLLRNAHEEADRIRRESEGVLAQRSQEASEITDAMRRAASDDAAAVRARAAAEAEAMVEAARARSREMLDEAKAVRAKILGDVTRRRNAARVQVAQLRAGRDRLLEAYRVVRETLDEVTVELERADTEARGAADTAGRRAAEEVDALRDELIAELDDADDIEPVSVAPSVVAVADEPAAIEFTADEPDAQREPEPEPVRRRDAPAPAPAAVEEPVVAEERPEEPPILVPTTPQPAPELAQALAAGELTVLEPPAPIEAVRVLPIDAPTPDDVEPHRNGSNGNGNGSDASVPEPESQSDDSDAALLQRRDEQIAPLEAQLARKLKRALQDEQNDVLDRLRVHRGRLDGVLAAADDQAARYRKVASPLLQQSARAGAEFAGGTLRAAGVDDLARDLASAIATPLRTRLESALAAAARDGDDEAAVAERIGAAYREWKMQRIERLAGDHVAAAFTRGAFDAAADAAELRWVVSDLDGPCPDCDDNALAGPTSRGAPYPTGQLHPPAHSGCRCLVVAAVP